ncbi:MAG: ATP-binding cassette domain-containing protein [Acidobacteriia bacterium]|nr:ATP-binding cassette domain-containing protein [Terriglobia bacterium]
MSDTSSLRPPLCEPAESAPNGKAAVEIRQLSRSFGSRKAVDNLSLHLPAGQIFGLLGPNGAGKSTTIKMLTTLLPPTSGSATVAGFDIARQPGCVRRSIGYVPQVISAEGSLTGYENLLVFAKLYGIRRSLRKKRIQQILEFMGLAEVQNVLVQKYSGGMIRRLEIALALLHQPPILFLDEPTVGLDPTARQLVWEHIEQLRRDVGTTILMTTHQMGEADALCDVVAIMHEGQIRAVGSPAELKSSVGDGATLDDVFAFYTAEQTDQRGGFTDVIRARRTARRLG